MGLDLIEIVLRTEETFTVDLPDHECADIHTVGDLYRLVLQKLDLPYQPATDVDSQVSGRDRSRTFLNVSPWTTPDVWTTLKALIQDQLQVPPEEVHEAAHFQHDLRAD